MTDNDETKKKQELLQTEIYGANYDSNEFFAYLGSLKSI